jgi:hypothetical protein
MLKHADIWRAIDALARVNDLSASGLARKAGLDVRRLDTDDRERLEAVEVAIGKSAS